MAIILGVVAFTKMTTDLLPSMNLPYVVVMTTYPGANPETVETVVTAPVESAMATVSNIENISSVSGDNYSMVIMEFAQTTNMDSVSLEIRESLDQISSYWDDTISNPIIMKLNPDMLPVMVAAVGKEGMTNAKITDYANNKLIPELESLEGVASVDGSGLVEESVHVIIRQEKIDQVNEQVFGYLEDQFADAEKEITKGQKELNTSIVELQNSEAELNQGKQELEDGMSELESGIDSLDAQKAAVAKQLAEAKAQLNEAKDQLQMKLTQIDAGITEIDTQLLPLQQSAAELQAVSEGLAKLQETAESAETQNPGSGDTVVAAGVQELLKEISTEAVADLIKEVDTQAELAVAIGYVNATAADVKTQLESAQKTADAAKEPLLKTQAQLEEQKKLLNEQLTELNKNEILAAIEMGSGSAVLNITKSQLESAKEQLESSQAQLDSAWDQINDAKKQLADGKEELEEQKESALESADMSKVLTVDTIKSLLAAQNFSMPGGYVTEEGIEYLVRIGDKPEDVESLANMPLMNLNMEGVDTICLKDVADVFMTDNSQETYTNINGNPGVLLSIQKQTGYSTGEVSDKLDAKFEELMAEDSTLDITPLMDQGIYIDLVMDSIISNILLGAALAVIILIFFLRDIKPTFVIACSIPISLVTTVVLMYFSGVTLNVISLSGLALGIGMLVDNSIVVIENIYRMRSEGVPMKEAAIEGAREVGGAILASTLTTVCVFLPIVFTEGITRQLFVDMGLTIGYSLLASLAVAMTVVPAMSSKMLVTAKTKQESRFFTGMISGYEKLLKLALKAKPVVIIGAVVLLIVSAVAAMSNGTAFMEEMDSTQMSATVTLEEGASLDDTREVTDEAIRRIMTIEDVEDVGAMTSSGTMSMMSGGSSDNVATVYITLKEDKTRDNKEIGKEIEKLVADLDCEFSVETSSMDMSAMGGSGIQINIKGRDLDTLQEIATELAGQLGRIEGLTEISDGQEETTGELRVIVDREKAIEKGLTVAQVFAMLNAKLADPGSATTLVTEVKDYNVLVMDGEDIELTRDAVEEMVLTISKEDGTYEELPLKEIAAFERTEGVKSIRRDAQSRVISVSAALADGYNVGLVGADVEEMLENYDLPAGYTAQMTGENETINEAMGQLMLMLVLAVAFMYLIMVAQFQSLMSPFIVMFTIPLAFTGGFLALFMGGFEVSVIAMIGFIMLSGVIVNNGIVLIDYMNQLRERGMQKYEAIIEAGKTRLRPVLMTALTTILAMSTMVFSKDMGADMARPMAVVTVGGLLYGTLLTLFVIPCIYDWFMKTKKKKVHSDEMEVA